jgi:3-dehydrosphinganine reductase
MKLSHALVTGGSSGIGLETARQLAARGATVSLLARRADVLASAAAELGAAGASVHTASADVADQAVVVQAVKDLEAQAGPIDVLVTSAGQARPGHFLDLEDEVFRRMMEVDYFGTLYAVRAVAPGMVERGHGSIVAVSSGAGLVGLWGYTAYSPAKFAVRGLMETLRGELRPHGVRVSCVYPPDVDTPQLTDENRYKPAETAAISGAVKPMSPADVATSIVKAVDSGRFAVYPNRQMAVLAGLGPLLAPLVRRVFDRKARSVR